MQPPTLLRPPAPLTIPRDPQAPAKARRHVRGLAERSTLTADQAEAVELIVSELVTNSVQHAHTSDLIRVIIEHKGAHVRIEVHDANRRPPMTAPVSDESETGRGLLLVTALSARWGWSSRPFGKSVWAEVKA